MLPLTESEANVLKYMGSGFDNVRITSISTKREKAFVNENDLIDMVPV